MNNKNRRRSLTLNTINYNLQKDISKLEKETTFLTPNIYNYKINIDSKLFNSPKYVFSLGSHYMNVQFLKNFIKNKKDILFIDNIIFEYNFNDYLKEKINIPTIINIVFKDFFDKNKEYINSIIKFLKNKNKTILVHLQLKKNNFNKHSNGLFINYTNNDLYMEYFEPHGDIPASKDVLLDNILKKMIEYIGKQIKCKTIVFKTSSELYSTFGPQVKQEFSKNYTDNMGYCQTFAIFYLYLKITNRNTNTQELLKDLSSFPTDILFNIIVNFANNIMNDKNNLPTNIKRKIDNVIKIINELLIKFPKYKTELQNINLNKGDFILELKKLNNLFWKLYLEHLNTFDKLNIILQKDNKEQIYTDITDKFINYEFIFYLDNFEFIQNEDYYIEEFYKILNLTEKYLDNIVEKNIPDHVLEHIEELLIFERKYVTYKDKILHILKEYNI